MLTIFIAITMVFLPAAKGHGMMCTPRQRGAYRSGKCGNDLISPTNPVMDFCAHCLNGGTVAGVKNHLPPSGWHTYDPISNFNLSAGRAGLCGDPKGTFSHMIGGAFMPYASVPIVDVYREGSEIDFMVEIDTNHNGYFEFFLCNLDKCGDRDISSSCFRKKACYRLNRVPHQDCQNPSSDTWFDCGPIDTKYPSRFYVPCRKTGHVGVHYVGGSSGTMRYRLPAGVRCDHCVLQWYWATGNSCAPPGFLSYFDRYGNPFGTTCAGDGGARGAHRNGMSTCKGMYVPEEFWSCADVQITPNGTGTGTVPIASPHPENRNSGYINNSSDESGKEGDKNHTMDEPGYIDIEMDPGSAPEPTEFDDQNSGAKSCLPNKSPCDGSRPCCHIADVCVYIEDDTGFRCARWWTLHNLVERRRDRI